jgi:hypothetical protein
MPGSIGVDSSRSSHPPSFQPFEAVAKLGETILFRPEKRMELANKVVIYEKPT